MVTADDVRLEAVSPTGRVIRMNGDGMYHAQFGPEEIGLYREDSEDHCDILSSKKKEKKT